MACDILNNTGFSGCRENIGPVSGVLLASSPFSILKTELAVKADIEALMIAEDDRLYLIQDLNDYENVAQRELQTATTASGQTLYYGQNGHAFNLKVRRPSYYEVQTKLFDGAESADLYGILITKNGFYIGNEDGDNINSRKFQVAKNLRESEDYTTDEMLVYSFSESEPSINIKRHWFDQPTEYDPNELAGIVDVDVTVLSASATEIIATVSKSGSPSSIVAALLAANFKKLDSTGAVEVISGVTYSGGQYTITGAAFTTGTLGVLPVVGDSVFYESPDYAAVTVGS